MHWDRGRTGDLLSRELLELRRLLAARAGGAALPRPHESAEQFYARARRTATTSARTLPRGGSEGHTHGRGPMLRSRLLRLALLLAALIAALALGLWASAGAFIPRPPAEPPGAEAPAQGGAAGEVPPPPSR